MPSCRPWVVVVVGPTFVSAPPTTAASTRTSWEAELSKRKIRNQIFSHMAIPDPDSDQVKIVVVTHLQGGPPGVSPTIRKDISNVPKFGTF